MPDILSSFVLYGIPASLLVLILTQAAKQAGISARWAPLLSLLFGVLVGLAIQYETDQLWLKGAVIGLVLGWTASGLYSHSDTFARSTSPPTA